MPGSRGLHVQRRVVLAPSREFVAAMHLYRKMQLEHAQFLKLKLKVRTAIDHHAKVNQI